MEAGELGLGDDDVCDGFPEGDEDDDRDWVYSLNGRDQIVKLSEAKAPIERSGSERRRVRAGKQEGKSGREGLES
jgi:hypothetical protein